MYYSALPSGLLSLVALTAAVSAQGFVPVSSPLGIANVMHSSGPLGSGVCVADFDGDRDMDVVIATPSGNNYRYFRNDGGMQFSDLSLVSGLGICGTVLCMQAGDVDNDGDADIFVGREFEPARLFINDGSGFFTEEAAIRGIVNDAQNYGASFGDYDRDGWIDLYVGNRYEVLSGSTASANKLFRNLGNGYFQDVTTATGVAGDGLTLATAFFDYNEDGWPDIMEVNDKGNFATPNDLYENNGDGTFTSVATQVGADVPIDGMGFDFLDVFNDGGVDFYCSDIPPDHLFQVWDPATSTYTIATAAYGLQGGGIGWAVNFLDYDNDGWQDLHVVQMLAPNLLFHNPAAPVGQQQPWTDVAPFLGLDHAVRQFTVAIADFDDDGLMDILERFHEGPPWVAAPDGAEIYQNTGLVGNWLKFDLEGTVSNRDAFGTRIEVLTGSHLQRQWVRSGVGYVTSSDPRVHFGLGTATVADLVTITWPSGQVQYLTDVPASGVVELLEPKLTLSAPAQVGASTTLDLSVPGDEGLPYLMPLAFSMSNGSVVIGGKIVPIVVDGLTTYSLSTGNLILPGSVGLLDASGQAASGLNIPAVSALSGLTFYATAVTIDMVNFPILRTVFPRALAITIQ